MRPGGRLFARGFLLQALFNPAGQQRGGFLWAVGATKKISPEEPFNANPSLAGYAIGLSFASSEKEFAHHRAALSSALGALGDRLVWGLLRPMAVILALVASAAGAIPAAAVLLLVYNPPELCLRWRATERGLLGLQGVTGDLAKGGLPRIASLIGRAAVALLGCLAGFWLAGPIGTGHYREAVAGCAGVGIATLVLRRKSDPSGMVAACGSLLLGLLWLAIERL